MSEDNRRLWLERWNRQLWEMAAECETFFGPPGENNPNPVEEAVRSARYVVSAELATERQREQFAAEATS